MNSVSVTGKKWIFKKFDSADVASIKENFFLNENLIFQLLVHFN